VKLNALGESQADDCPEWWPCGICAPGSNGARAGGRQEVQLGRCEEGGERSAALRAERLARATIQELCHSSTTPASIRRSTLPTSIALRLVLVRDGSEEPLRLRVGVYSATAFPTGTTRTATVGAARSAPVSNGL